VSESESARARELESEGESARERESEGESARERQSESERARARGRVSGSAVLVDVGPGFHYYSQLASPG